MDGRGKFGKFRGNRMAKKLFFRLKSEWVTPWTNVRILPPALRTIETEDTHAIEA